ncbi:MAG: tRNA (adenosine(37)-N6)-threonylcarbamoyltransferase complex dimerization subunit type 1 TsaB [Parachlamydiaceae bacterium]|nr:tRNA (adenosine(37)-N6)-threonylcarbamoyltransferase complex dimerization subunit type 1 TsaB [Parachlamydiaceae bacterium]
MRALIIETSTERGLLALVEDEKILWSKELPFGYNQSKSLMPELQSMMQTLHPFPMPDCLGVGIGPGSYTGIRIGVAAGKALAYSWKLPLIGVCSLMGFIPEGHNGTFAAIIDARMGGAYVLKGKIVDGIVEYIDIPKICSLIELNSYLKDTQVIVTPVVQSLKAKLAVLYPQSQWEWKEVTVSASALNKEISTKFQRKEWSINGQVELLYLRKTEAELEKERKYSNHTSTEV